MKLIEFMIRVNMQMSEIWIFRAWSQNNHFLDQKFHILCKFMQMRKKADEGGLATFELCQLQQVKASEVVPQWNMLIMKSLILLIRSIDHSLSSFSVYEWY